MTEDLHEIIKTIKKEFRLSMNGVVSTLQRRQGLDYKINFGVEIPRLKDIAAKYQKNKELASALWQENIRESKLLAIYLMPEEEYESIAEVWTESAKYTEIADILSMHILQRIPNSLTHALEWISRKEGIFAHCGYMTLSHLFRAGYTLDATEEEKFFREIINLFNTEGNKTTRTCAYNTLVHYLEEDNNREERFITVAQDCGSHQLLEMLA
jgi:hypothetical protein